MTTVPTAGHGPNIGSGFIKYIVIDEYGQEQPPIVFPALLAPAQRAASGAVRRVRGVRIGDNEWWVGEDALLADTQRSCLGAARLSDPYFIPAMLLRAWEQLGELGAGLRGACVTGLPATWVGEAEKTQRLGARMRDVDGPFTSIDAIAEPLGMIYASVLDNNGEIAGDTSLLEGDVAVVDGGHLTVDVAMVKQLVATEQGMRTWQLGTIKPLEQIQARLQAHFDCDIPMHAVDLAVRNGTIKVGGKRKALPAHWDQPLIENGRTVVDKLLSVLGKGNQFEALLLGGGFALEERLVTPIVQAFPDAQVVPDPQFAIARGYARLARRMARDAAFDAQRQSQSIVQAVWQEAA